jgi:hypothetical protein
MSQQLQDEIALDPCRLLDAHHVAHSRTIVSSAGVAVHAQTSRIETARGFKHEHLRLVHHSLLVGRHQRVDSPLKRHFAFDVR